MLAPLIVPPPGLSRPSIATTRKPVPARPKRRSPSDELIETEPNRRARGDAAALGAIAVAEQRDAVERVRERDDVDGLDGTPRQHDERAVETALDLVRRMLVRVVPVRARVRRAEAVDVRAARTHAVLRHAGDAVLRIREVDAVPVDRHAVADVPVHERRLDEVSLVDRAARGPARGRRTSAHGSFGPTAAGSPPSARRGGCERREVQRAPVAPRETVRAPRAQASRRRSPSARARARRTCRARGSSSRRRRARRRPRRRLRFRRRARAPWPTPSHAST